MKNLKKLLVLSSAVCILASMAGCGSSSSSEGSSKGNSGSSTSEKSDDAADTAAASEDETSETDNNVLEIADEPSEEILAADFSSGLIQIGNDIFQNGGYMTVNDFISEYGSKYDVSPITVDEDFSSKTMYGRFTYYIKSIDESTEIVLELAPPVSENGNVGDAVIVMVWASDRKTKEHTWLPKGINNVLTGEKKAEDIIKTYEEYGLAKEEITDDRNVPLAERFPADQNTGKYAIHDDEKYTIAIASVALTKPNLYGYTPVVLLDCEDYHRGDEDDGVYFKYWEVFYNEGKSASS